MCLIIFNIIIRAFNLNVYSVNVLNWILNVTCLFLDFSSLWFAMWLCALYFVKVTIFKRALLIHMKLRIPQLVLYMTVSSVLIALLSSFIFVYNYNEPLDLLIPELNLSSNSSIEKELIFIPPAINAHLTAIRSASLVEFMTISYFIMTILLRFNFYQTLNKAVVFVLVTSYPTFHSMVLIGGNVKLKKRLLNVVHYVKGCEPLGNSCSSCENPK
ncbi:PREDICTED: taste receptor type 2 member 9-like [Nanorana parkeri]|uniref:taste receptor type 2 member 9-like n=1 Tax=Nanorana parkeri TaxID=125878 RepID=UPI000854456D|nr:PREDICTED: taste receptor type 2 member 9-like [Nanorana parkeri]